MTRASVQTTPFAMKTPLPVPRSPVSRLLRIASLRRFILVWSGAIGIAFLLLALDAVLTLRHLDDAARDEMNHAQRLQLVQNFEVAALEANRRPQRQLAARRRRTARFAKRARARRHGADCDLLP